MDNPEYSLPLDENDGDESYIPNYVSVETLHDFYGFLRYGDVYMVEDAIELHGGGYEERALR